MTTITLTVSANPRPNYAWSRNGEQVTSGNGLTLSLDSITFNPATREHSGTYRLIVTNSAGTGEFNFTLDVQCKIITSFHLSTSSSCNNGVNFLHDNGVNFLCDNGVVAHTTGTSQDIIMCTCMCGWVNR